MKEKIIQLIKESKETYLLHCSNARKKLAKNYDQMTAQQIAGETIFIQDMESRAYALSLLLEEIDEL